MIPLITKVIYDKLPNLTERAEVKLLKYSTSASGKRLDEKVIFFVFKDRATEPFLCVKTVRYYPARDVILRSFKNLQTLNAAVSGTDSEHLFPRALHLHDDGENIFSIESVCPGQRVRLDQERLARLVEVYSNFQAAVVRVSGGTLSSVNVFAEKLISIFPFGESDRKTVSDYFRSLPLSDIRLPSLIQHGDLTEDNILFSKRGPSIIDCDYAGFFDIPGFDLFWLFFRFDQKRVRQLCRRYLPVYFSKIGAKSDGTEYDGLLFLYYAAERVLRKTYSLDTESPAKKLIADFEVLIAS